MVTLQDMPEEIKTFVLEHDLVRSEPFTDEHQVGVQLALDRVITLVIKSFSELADQPSGREVVWNIARESADSPGPDGTAVVSHRGAGLVKSVLDDRYYGTAHAIATAAGVQTASVAALIDVVTVVTLELIGSQVAKHRWNAQELGRWLRTRQEIDPAAAASFVPESAAMGIPGAMGKATRWRLSPISILLLAAGLIAVAEFGYIMGKQPASNEATGVTGRTTGSQQRTAAPGANASGPDAQDATRSKAALPIVLKLKNGVRQIIGANSTESKLYQFLIDPGMQVDSVNRTMGWIGFDRIYFEPNKAVLTNESLWQLSNVASILKRFPAAKIRIGGYTDNSGSPYGNLKLSEARASAVLAALVSLGVPVDHLTSKGYGSRIPIVSNDTEEGRSLNRRVSLRVTQK